MRTTITLDDDLARRLEHARAQRSTTFKQIVNDAVRAGLAALETPAQRMGERSQTRQFRMGRPLIDVSNVGEALAVAEGEDYR